MQQPALHRRKLPPTLLLAQLDTSKHTLDTTEFNEPGVETVVWDTTEPHKLCVNIAATNAFNKQHVANTLRNVAGQQAGTHKLSANTLRHASTCSVLSSFALFGPIPTLAATMQSSSHRSARNQGACMAQHSARKLIHLHATTGNRTNLETMVSSHRFSRQVDVYDGAMPSVVGLSSASQIRPQDAMLYSIIASYAMESSSASQEQVTASKLTTPTRSSRQEGLTCHTIHVLKTCSLSKGTAVITLTCHWSSHLLTKETQAAPSKPSWSTTPGAKALAIMRRLSQAHRMGSVLALKATKNSFDHRKTWRTCHLLRT